MLGKELVIDIKEGSFIRKKYNNLNAGYDGYIIQTTDRVVVAGINNRSQCCEDWGYITTNDDISEFIGSELLDIRVTDKNLNTLELPPGIREENIIFITFITSKGDLQLAVYNEHDGYYSHEVLVDSNQLSYSDYL